jgi:hypothetical protein
VFLAAAPPGPGRITRHHLRAGGEEVIKMSETLNSDAAQVPDSLGAKLAMLRTLTADLAQQDWASVPACVQDEAVRVLEDADAAQAAVRGAVLTAFAAGPGMSWYGHQSVRSYLVGETRITRGAATGHLKWVKRHTGHPQVMAALARQQITASAAARICELTGLLPDEHQAMADDILLGAWLGGGGEGDLMMLAREMREQLCQDEDDDRPPVATVTVDTTLDGAGVINGDLTPGVTALVKAAFEKYAAWQGPGDTRTLDALPARHPLPPRTTRMNQVATRFRPR